MKHFILGFFFAIFVVFSSIVLFTIFNQEWGRERCPGCQKAVKDIEAIGLALNHFYQLNGQLPNSLNQLYPEYLEVLPEDAWGNKYNYSTFRFGNSMCFIVWSWGADGQPGGKKYFTRDIVASHEKGHCFSG